jgi:hypothetical protein
MTVEHVSAAKSFDELLRTLREKTFRGAPFEPAPAPAHRHRIQVSELQALSQPDT